MPENSFIDHAIEFDRLMAKLAALRAANFGAPLDTPNTLDALRLQFLVQRLREAVTAYNPVEG